MAPPERGSSAGAVGTLVAVSPPSGGLSSAAGTIPTVAGPVALRWSRRRRRMALTLTLPPNAAGHLTLPAVGLDAVTESSRPLRESPGVTVTGFAGGEARLEVGAGTYHFATRTA